MHSNLSVKLISSIGKLSKLSAKPAEGDEGATWESLSFGSSSEFGFTNKSPATDPDSVLVVDVTIAGAGASELDPSGNISGE